MFGKRQSWWAHEDSVGKHPVLSDPTGLAKCPEFGVVSAHLQQVSVSQEGWR